MFSLYGQYKRYQIKTFHLAHNTECDNWPVHTRRVSHSQLPDGTFKSQSGFSQTHKIGNIGINSSFVFLHIWSFILWFYHMMLVNFKLDVTVSECKRITFQCHILHWFSSFLMSQLKRNWKYWHFCIVESL